RPGDEREARKGKVAPGADRRAQVLATILWLGFLRLMSLYAPLAKEHGMNLLVKQFASWFALRWPEVVAVHPGLGGAYRPYIESFQSLNLPSVYSLPPAQPFT